MYTPPPQFSPDPGENFQTTVYTNSMYFGEPEEASLAKLSQQISVGICKIFSK
jgi:hypothetical protein